MPIGMICPVCFKAPADPNIQECRHFNRPHRLVPDTQGQELFEICSQCFLPKEDRNGNGEVCPGGHSKAQNYVWADALAQRHARERLKPVMVD